MPAVLLDTHAIIWFLNGDPQLSHPAKLALEDRSARRLISIVSIWEMAIKIPLGKLELRRDFSDLPEFVRANGFEMLPIAFAHADAFRHLPLHHRDPFDRMLLSQASVEDLTIVTRDEHFPAYGLPILW